MQDLLELAFAQVQRTADDDERLQLFTLDHRAHLGRLQSGRLRKFGRYPGHQRGLLIDGFEVGIAEADDIGNDLTEFLRQVAAGEQVALDVSILHRHFRAGSEGSRS